MTQRHKAAVSEGTTPAGKRKALDNKLTAIGGNMAETLTFICPAMTYKLYYKNDEGGTTYDDYIPSDILPMYRDKISEALEEAYFIQVRRPDVFGVVPGVEVIGGKLHGTLTVSSYHALSPETTEDMRNTLTDLVARWSIHFESRRIETDGGNLYVRFYDSNDPILPEAAFYNQLTRQELAMEPTQDTNM